MLTDKSKNVNLDFSSNGEFDAQLKFAGDTLLFHMHSNIFDFPPNHEIHKKKYIKDDNLKSFCGVINTFPSQSYMWITYQTIRVCGSFPLSIKIIQIS